MSLPDPSRGYKRQGWWFGESTERAKGVNRQGRLDEGRGELG
jgi:hypothetical protein